MSLLLASLLIKGTGLGLFKDILLDIAGIGGRLFQALVLSVGNNAARAFVPALCGEVLALLVKALKRS